MKKRVAVAIGAGIAPVIALSLPAATASSHGYITAPSSRAAQCAEGVVRCGEIKYEPYSVEGPKGLKSCSGGNARFSDLDDDSKGWKVSSINSNTTFTWNLKVPHSTSTWQYFVGGQKVAEFNDRGKVPGKSVSHQVNFGNITGKQKVLAVWNIADTDFAFYQCIDVNIGGGNGGDPDPDPDPDPEQCTAGAWSASAVYNSGDTVTYGDHTWRARWWVQGEQPGAGGDWGVWEDLGACSPA